MSRTRLHYLIGATVSATAGVVTLLVKSAMTKYPGFGDLLLLTSIDLITREQVRRVIDDGRVLLRVEKALLAIGVFSLLYFAFKNAERFRLLAAVILTAGILVAMSFGKAVVG